MRGQKRRWELFSFYDHTGIEAHLEKMAREGWLIEKISAYGGWKYRRIEPEELRFTVTYYAKASDFDPEPGEGQREFWDFCRHTGWELACSCAQMQIFYNRRENPVPLETDPLAEVTNLHAAVKKSFLFSYAFLAVLALLQIVLFLVRLCQDPIGILSSNMDLFAGSVWPFLLIVCAVDLACYGNWYKKAKRAALRGDFLKTPNTSRIQKLCLGIFEVVFLFWLTAALTGESRLDREVLLAAFLYMAALLLAVNGVKALLKRRKVSAGTNRVVTAVTSLILSFVLLTAVTVGVVRMNRSGVFAKDAQTYEFLGQTRVLYQDELPLTVEDLKDVTYEDYVRERRAQESPFLAQFHMSQYPKLSDLHAGAMVPEGLDYTITLVKLPALYGLCRERLFREEDERDDDRILEGYKRIYEPQDPAPWGAREAYRLTLQGGDPLNWYLLCYEDRLVELTLDWEPDGEQMRIAGEKLRS